MKENSTQCVYERGLKYVLRLYVTGITSRSKDAIRKVREICEQDLNGFYELEVVYEQSDLGDEGKNIAVSSSIRRLPSPLKKLINEMSNDERVIVGIEIVPMDWSSTKIAANAPS